MVLFLEYNFTSCDASLSKITLVLFTGNAGICFVLVCTRSVQEKTRETSFIPAYIEARCFLCIYKHHDVYALDGIHSLLIFLKIDKSRECLTRDLLLLMFMSGSTERKARRLL